MCPKPHRMIPRVFRERDAGVQQVLSKAQPPRVGFHKEQPQLCDAIFAGLDAEYRSKAALACNRYPPAFLARIVRRQKVGKYPRHQWTKSGVETVMLGIKSRMTPDQPVGVASLERAQF